MPPFLTLVLAGVGSYLVYRIVKAEMERVSRVIEESQLQPKRVEIRLTRDRESGVYRYKGPGEI